MSVTPIEQQPETIALAAVRFDYPQRFNLLDMLGLTDSLPAANHRPGTFGPPDSDSSSQPVVDWELIGKRSSSHSSKYNFESKLRNKR